jgi:hypothetical protein
MKKIQLLVGIIVLMLVVISCDKKEIEATYDVIFPFNGTAIYLPGNTSCEDIGFFPISSGKVDYLDGNFVFEGTDTEWPLGLVVTVTDGRYISFALPEKSQYCVGAVIVKGGPAANIYTYSPGVRFDVELSAPINSSGRPAGLSNLTFCFVECPPPTEEIITAKVKFSDGSGVDKFGVTEGTNVFTTGWCGEWYLGVNDFVTPDTIMLHQAAYPYLKVGDVIVLESGDVKVDLIDGYNLINAALFVGTEDDLKSYLWTDNCPAYYAAPWMYVITGGNEYTFNLP